MTRREILRSPLLFGGVPVICCETPDLPEDAISFADGTMTIDLRRVGAAAKYVNAGRKLNLIITQPEKGKYFVLDRPCTHGGGPVAYHAKHHTVQCTCWGRSEFALEDGRVLAGPAKRALKSYPVRAAGGRLVVTL